MSNKGKVTKAQAAPAAKHEVCGRVLHSSGCVLRSRSSCRPCPVRLRSRSRRVPTIAGHPMRTSKARPSVVWRPASIVQSFDSRVLKANGEVARRLLDQKMRPPSGGGVTRGLYRERMRLHGHLEAAMVTRLNAELSRRLLWEEGGWRLRVVASERRGHMAPRAVKAGSRGAETPTAREEWGGYARREWLFLLERERVADGQSSATEMPIPTGWLWRRHHGEPSHRDGSSYAMYRDGQGVSCEPTWCIAMNSLQHERYLTVFLHLMDDSVWSVHVHGFHDTRSKRDSQRVDAEHEHHRALRDSFLRRWFTSSASSMASWDGLHALTCHPQSTVDDRRRMTTMMRP